MEQVKITKIFNVKPAKSKTLKEKTRKPIK